MIAEICFLIDSVDRFTSLDINKFRLKTTVTLQSTIQSDRHVDFLIKYIFQFNLRVKLKPIEVLCSPTYTSTKTGL